MKKKPENPLVFPTTDANEASINGCKGMTLRDYFAAKAMQAMLSNDALVKDAIKNHGGVESMRKWMPKSAYIYADDLLAVREADNGN